MGTDAEGKNPTEVVVDDSVDAAVVDLPSTETPKPSTEPEMLTKEQAEKLTNERHSKLDKRISELEKATSQSTKAREAAEARAKAAEDRLAETQRQAEEAEREEYKDSPDALSLFDQRVKHRQNEERLKKEREAFEAEKATHAEEMSEAKQYKVTKLADEIASTYGVDSSLLIQLTDGSREKMERLAKSLPKKEAGDNKPNLQKPPDSGKTSGRFGKPNLAQLESMSMDQYAEYVKERDKHK